MLHLSHVASGNSIRASISQQSEYLQECDKYEKEHQAIAFPTTIDKDDEISVVTDEEEETGGHDTTSTQQYLLRELI